MFVALDIFHFSSGMRFCPEGFSIQSSALRHAVLKTDVSDFSASGGILRLSALTASVMAILISLPLNHNRSFDILIGIVSSL
jgi:hypothetical protein